VVGVVLFVHAAIAESGYRFTTGHKTRVWIDLPGQDNTLTWSGDKDAEGYATGHGSLTFYRADFSRRVTGSSIPTGRPVMVRKLTGTMTKGKFEGVVVMNSAAGAITHVKFAHGVASGEWREGDAPEPKAKAVVQRSTPTQENPSEPEELKAAPAEGPPSATIEISDEKKDTQTAGQSRGSESLRSLTAPPSSLPQTDARLSRAEVIRAADEQAILQGLNVGDYQRRKANYDSSAGHWTVSYEETADHNASHARKHFTVIVDDKTSKASVAPEE
jgi:hypothetical protein